MIKGDEPRNYGKDRVIKGDEPRSTGKDRVIKGDESRSDDYKVCDKGR